MKKKRTETPSAAVHCAHQTLVALDELRPHPQNPNRHPPAQIRLLSRILLEAGWRAPIVVSSRSGLIVAGHGRLEAARLAGLTHAPVDYQEFHSEAEELRHLLADNKLAELANADHLGLSEVMARLDKEMQALTGFGEREIERMMRRLEPKNAVPKIDPPPDVEARPPAAPSAPAFSTAAVGSGARILMLALPAEINRRWIAWRELCGVKSDITAFERLLDSQS